MKTSIITPTTLERFEALPEGPPYHQLIKGVIIPMPSPTFFHQDIISELILALRGDNNLKARGKVVAAPLDVYLNENNVYQPDLLFIEKDRLPLLLGTDKKIHGAPDWVCEILSSSTSKYDLNEKKEVYFQSGVKEYWMIDPEDQSIHVLTRAERGFKTFDLVVKCGKIHSEIFPELNIMAENLFA